MVKKVEVVEELKDEVEYEDWEDAVEEIAEKIV